jgi:hypothetical protein
VGLHYRLQAVVKVGDILLLIVERDYYGILGHGVLIIDLKGDSQFLVLGSQLGTFGQ